MVLLSHAALNAMSSTSDSFEYAWKTILFSPSRRDVPQDGAIQYDPSAELERVSAEGMTSGDVLLRLSTEEQVMDRTYTDILTSVDI